MSTTISNLTTVQNIYDAFGRGDIPFIMDNLAEDAVWEHIGNPGIVPFAGTFKGKPAILQFFQALGGSIQLPVFVPQNFREKGNQVINDVYMEGLALNTGKTYTATISFTWTFDENSQIRHWKNEGDVSGLEAALS